MSAQDNIATLQRFVDSYVSDVNTVQEALSSGDTPTPAKRILAGALNYVLDMLDMFPDHYKGLGLTDDAIVLRLAAKLAADAGATHEGLGGLAADATEVGAIFGPLAAGLERLVGKLPDRSVHGRTADQIVADKDTKALFDRDVNVQLRKYTREVIDTTVGGPERALKELEKMVKHALDKAGIK